MPWKLILFILSVILVTIFIGFNLENACDVSLGVYVFKDVPIFMSLLLAFALGVLIMLPFTFGHSKKEKKPTQKKQSAVSTSSSKTPSYSDGSKPEINSSSQGSVNPSESSKTNSSEVK